MKITPQYAEDVVLMSKSLLDIISPFKNENIEAALNWCNRDYPIEHEHEHWELFVVVSGKVLHIINGNERCLKKGDVCLVRPSDKHSLTFEETSQGDYQCINIAFSDEFAQKLFSAYGCYEEFLEKFEPMYVTIDDVEMTSIHDRALLTQTFAVKQYETSVKLIITTMLIKFLEQQLLFNSDYPKWFNLFLTYISNPATFGQSVEELAKHTAYSYSRLSMKFKEYTGMTIVNYVNEKKMLYAKRLLQSTEFGTIQIAEKLGYNSLSFFNHMFKKTYNITPSEYRKQFKRR